MTPWQVPPDVALGMMMNLGPAVAWNTVPILQGISTAFAGKAGLANFQASLLGRNPSIREAIAAHFEQQRSNAWPSI